jgi:hypothetical protein
MPRLHIDTYPKPDEYKIIQQKATELNMSMSTYMIFVAVNAEIKVTVKEEGK